MTALANFGNWKTGAVITWANYSQTIQSSGQHSVRKVNSERALGGAEEQRVHYVAFSVWLWCSY